MILPQMSHIQEYNWKLTELCMANTILKKNLCVYLVIIWVPHCQLLCVKLSAANEALYVYLSIYQKVLLCIYIVHLMPVQYNNCFSVNNKSLIAPTLL